jgi:hypothetical protein
MFTLSIMPNFKGTKTDFIKGFIICLSLDCLTILPLIF